MECFPAFNYARNSHEIHINGEGADMVSEGITIRLNCNMPLQHSGCGLVSEFTLQEGQTTTFALDETSNNLDVTHPFDEEESERLFSDTVEYWQQLAFPMHLPGPVAGNGATVGPGVEAADLQPHGRHRSRAHLQFARGPGRSAQLGTIAIPGFGTRPLPSTPCCASASPRKLPSS